MNEQECLYCGMSPASTAHNTSLPGAHEFAAPEPVPKGPSLGQLLDEQIASLNGRLDVIEARLRAEEGSDA